MILTKLATYLTELVAGLVTERSTDGDNEAKMRRFLKSWIDHNKEDATWIALIGRIEKIHKEAARKIRAMRYPAEVEDQGLSTAKCLEHDNMVIMANI